jgi:predicted metal-dependent hydrolase
MYAMSASLPDGERFFIDSVRHYQKDIEDPVLLEQIRSFIGQEAHHSRVHEDFVLHSKTEIHAQTKTATVNLSLLRDTLSAPMCAYKPACIEISHNRVANRIG